MSEPTTPAPQTGTELSAPDRARLALKFDATKLQLEHLAKQSERITEIRDAASYAECHGARMELKAKRVDIQRIAKAAREDATKFSKAVIAVENELVGIISPEEQRLQKLQDAEDERKDREKRLKIEAEERRVRGHQQRIEEMRALPFEAFGMTEQELQERTVAFAAAAPGEDFEEFLGEATAAHAVALSKLQQMLERLREQRAEAERLREEREQLERERAAAEAERKEAERQAQERRAAEEAEAAERRRQEEEAAAAERQRQADAEHQRRLEAEERERRERAERDRQEAEQREARRQQEEKERAERAEADRLERERLQRERDELAERERKLAEQQEQERLQRIEEEAAGMDLLLAANDAHALLVEEGLEQRNRTLRLAAVLRRMNPKAAAAAEGAQ